MSTDVCLVSDFRRGPAERQDIAPAADGRFMQVLRGGVWVGSARRAHCVTRGGGIWLPPCVAYRIYAVYEAELRELRIAPALSAGFVQLRRIVRCSVVLTSLMSASGRHALARAPEAVAALLFDELDAAAQDGTWALTVDMPSAQSRLARVCDEMILHPGREARLDEIAGRAGISKRTLHRTFVDELGTSAGRWRQTALAGSAMCALALDMPVAAAARDLGFTPSAFSTFFKSHVGWAPHQWLARQAATTGGRFE